MCVCVNNHRSERINITCRFIVSRVSQNYFIDLHDSTQHAARNTQRAALHHAAMQHAELQHAARCHPPTSVRVYSRGPHLTPPAAVATSPHGLTWWEDTENNSQSILHARQGIMNRAGLGVRTHITRVYIIEIYIYL